MLVLECTYVVRRMYAKQDFVYWGQLQFWYSSWVCSSAGNEVFESIHEHSWAGSIQAALQLHIFYNNWQLMFEAIGRYEKGYALQFQRACYAKNDLVLVPGEVENETVTQKRLQTSNMVDQAVYYISFPMFSSLHSPMEDQQLSAIEIDELCD